MRVHMVPRSGLLIRNPETGRYLPAEGEEVEHGPFWIRRIADGDASIRSEAKPRRSRGAASAEE